MEKQKFTFINEGNGIEGIIESGIVLDTKTSATPKVAIKPQTHNLIWDPIFECFIEKQEGHEYVLEKGTVHLHVK